MIDKNINISVVIPTKNRSKYLPRCLDSIIKQSYPVGQIIVIDDGSVDDTKQVVKNYETYGVEYVRLINGSGAQCARNYGVKISKYEWIAFQDSDDIWMPDKIALQIEALRKREYYKYTVVHGDGIKRNEITGIENSHKLTFTSGNCYKQLLIKSGPMFQALLVSKEAIIKAGGLDNDCLCHQEWETSIRLSKICNFIHIQEPLFIWNWHSGDTISKDYKRNIYGFNYIINRYKQEIISMHGLRGWRKIKMQSICNAIGYKLWEEAEELIDYECNHYSFIIAMKLIKKRISPKGIGRILQILAH